MTRIAGVAVVGAVGGVLLACGARTDLGVSGLPYSDGGVIALGDAAPPGDGGSDTGNPCPLPIETAYLLDDDGAIYRYDPVPAKATLLGTPDCSNGNVQWTATFSRQNAYIVYTDWTIYAVDLATMACAPTPFQPGQLGIGGEFGVAISASGGTEKLYVYGEDNLGGNPVLAVADLSSFVLTKVGAVTPAPSPDTFPVNLTADPLTGQLYAFSPGGYLQKIDPTTGAVSFATTTTFATLSQWAQVVFMGTDYIFVGDAVFGYDLTKHDTTSMNTTALSPVGGGTVLSCQ